MRASAIRASAIRASASLPRRRQQPAGDQGRKLAPGARVAIRNLNGAVTVTGWDRDWVEATAGDQTANVRIYEDASLHGGIVITTESPGGRRGGEAHLVVKLPHSVQIDQITTMQGNIAVSGIDGSVSLKTGAGDIEAAQVGGLTVTTGGGTVRVRAVSGATTIHTGGGDVRIEAVSGATNILTGGGVVAASNVAALTVHTGGGNIRATTVNGPANIQTGGGDVILKDIKGNLIGKVTSGDLSVEDVRGLIDLTMTSGDVRIRNAGGDVRINTISSAIDVRCVKGRVEARSADGEIVLAGIGGDVDARSTSGEVSFTGAIHTNGHYTMKSTSGQVRMLIPPETPGFTATMSSYNGEIQTDFPLNVESTPNRGPLNRKIVGVYGDGQAQITLDSFNGSATLAKKAAATNKDCK
jgi:DUF4097 and DUF4098 domain-containing protein YvlB